MARLFDRSIPEFLVVDTAVVLTAPFTVSAWAKSSTGIPDQTVFFLGDKDAPNSLWALRFMGSGAGDPIEWRVIAGGSSFAQTTTGYTAGTWHHVAAVEASGTDRRVFIDGGSKGTNTNNRNPANADRTAIGMERDSTPNRGFTGDIGHVAVWNVALTDAEIATLAAGVSPLRVRRGALVGYWPVNGQSPEPDVVGGLNMTLSGSAKSEEPPIPHSIVAP